MKIKRFQGKSEQEIIEQIKEDLGPSAIILNIKTIKGNWLSKILKKDKIEITAAIDEEVPQPISETKNQNFQGAELSLEDLKVKMSNMEQLLTTATQRMDDLYNKPKEKAETPVEAQAGKCDTENIIYEHLLKQEVEEEVARVLLRETDDLGENPEIQDVIRIVYNNICKMIGAPSLIGGKDKSDTEPKIIFFIGPTGVGKTTSIAKLTAEFSLRKNKKVGLITADTYRIAAIEQLRTYAEILSVPLKVVYSPEELQVGIEAFDDKDFIFIDTAGRSHKNEEHLEELEDMLKMFPQKKVYLVLSATTKFTDIISIVKRYTKLCHDYSILMTKTDETASAGTIVNLKYFTQRSLSYVSFGQNVPDDIEEINGPKYAKILLGSLSDE